MSKDCHKQMKLELFCWQLTDWLTDCSHFISFSNFEFWNPLSSFKESSYLRKLKCPNSDHESTMSDTETLLSCLTAAYESSDDGDEPLVYSHATYLYSCLTHDSISPRSIQEKKFKDLSPVKRGLLETVLPNSIISNEGSTWYCNTRINERRGWSGYYKCRSCKVLALALSLIFALTDPHYHPKC